jgi:hypothetical protein
MMVQGVLNRISFKFIFTNPGLKHSGVFYLEKRKMEQIDYTKLNERVVEQACEAVLTKEQLQKLIQDKFDRATIYHQALVKSPTFSVN